LVVNQLNVNLEAFHKIVDEYLGKTVDLEGKFNPHSLTDEHKELGVTACEDLIQTWQTSTHFKYVAVREELWVFQYDPETERRSMNRKT
jgi:hypothetical protein